MYGEHGVQMGRCIVHTCDMCFMIYGNGFTCNGCSKVSVTHQNTIVFYNWQFSAIFQVIVCSFVYWGDFN